MATTRALTAELVWTEALKFQAASGSNALVIDGDSSAGPSPLQLLAWALAGCMSIDLVDILHKGRHRVKACRASLRADRASEPPRRILGVTLHFMVEGDAPGKAVERAIALSRERYCSVWHSLRQDIELRTSYEVGAGGRKSEV
jgi:putative redox protein